MTEWQPIETAPKDGTSILVGCSYYRHGKSQVTLAWHDRGMWVEGSYWDDEEEEFVAAQCEFKPTHWMPLPAPPPADGGDTLASVLSDLAQRQEPLGAEFQRALDADREGLYEP